MDPRKDKVAALGLFLATLSSVYIMMYLAADMARTCAPYPVAARWSSFRVMELGFVIGATTVLNAVWQGLVGWYRARKR